MTDPVTLSLCGCRRGVFLLTPCVSPAAGRCSGCGVPLCPEHTRLRGGAPFCPQCYGVPDDDDDGDRSYGSNSSNRTGSAAGDWDAAADDAAGNQANGMAEPFAAEDYAAFDAVSDFDKNAGVDDGYDS